MDQKKIEEGVRLILEGIGEDPEREGLLETPQRVARMCEEIYGGMKQDAREHLEKQFHVENNNMVVERTSRFIPPVNITCCLFTERLMWPTSRTVR